MEFRNYINNLPNVKVETVKELAEKTSSTVQTVYRWVSGEVEPPLVKKKIIAECIGKSIEELFPDKIN